MGLGAAASFAPDGVTAHHRSADAPPDRLYMRGENAKMFERTTSRLDEMQSKDWQAMPHLT